MPSKRDMGEIKWGVVLHGIIAVGRGRFLGTYSNSHIIVQITSWLRYDSVKRAKWLG